MVKSKYLLAIIGMGIVLFLYFIVSVAAGLIRKQPLDYIALLYSLIPMLAVGTLFSSLSLPIMFKLGVEKGRLWFALLAALLGGSLGAAIGFGSVDAQKIASYISQFPVLLLLFAIAVIFSVSLFLSIKIYEKRDL